MKLRNSVCKYNKFKLSLKACCVKEFSLSAAVKVPKIYAYDMIYWKVLRDAYYNPYIPAGVPKLFEICAHKRISRVAWKRSWLETLSAEIYQTWNLLRFQTDYVSELVIHSVITSWWIEYKSVISKLSCKKMECNAIKMLILISLIS